MCYTGNKTFHKQWFLVILSLVALGICGCYPHLFSDFFFLRAAYLPYVKLPLSALLTIQPHLVWIISDCISTGLGKIVAQKNSYSSGEWLSNLVD